MCSISKRTFCEVLLRTILAASVKGFNPENYVLLADLGERSLLQLLGLLDLRGQVDLL